MKAKQVVACLFIVIGLMLGSVQASEQSKKENTLKIDKYIIRINEKNFPVSKEILEQFKLYKATKHFEKKTANIKTPSIIKKDKTITWDITDFIKASGINTDLIMTFGINMEEDFFIQVLLDVAVGKTNPYDIPQKTLFEIIKLADFLGNDKVMQKCTPALIEKLIGKTYLVDPVATYNTIYDYFEPELLPNGSEFIAEAKNGEWKLWDINQPNPILTFNETYSFPRLLPNGNGFITKAKDGEWKLWDIKLPNPTYTFNGVDNNPKFLPNGSGFIAKTKKEEWKLWDINQPNPTLTFNEAYSFPRLLPNGSGFIAKTKKGEWKLWNIKQPYPILTFNGVDNNPEFLPNGSVFITRSVNMKWKLWNIKKSNPILTFNGVGDYPELLPNGSGFIARSVNMKWKLWNIKKSNPTLTFNEASDFPRFLLDSSGFIAKAKNKKWKLWKFETPNLTFEQIKLIYKIFTSNKGVEIVKNEDYFKTLTSLPNNLQKAIKKSKNLDILKKETNFKKKWKKRIGKLIHYFQ